MRNCISVTAIAVLAICCPATLRSEDAVVLFDGKTLDNWTVLKCEAEVQDGAILVQAGNGLVQSKKQYTDYVFECEWKTVATKQWDSGIYFAYNEVPKGRPWPSKYQVNLRKGMEGELVGFKSGVNKVPIDAHQWTHFQLTVRGSTAALTVNGKPSWKVDGIKPTRGFVALQAEVPLGGQFLFRNIHIRELPEK